MRPAGRAHPLRPAETRCKPTDARREVGREGEDHAARHLERLGFRLLARNVRTRYGEIDLVAFDGQVLVFAEVKTRRHDSRRAGSLPSALPLPLESLRPRQCAHLRRLAGAWLTDADERPWAQTIRFDAIGVVLDHSKRLLGLEHLEGAW